MNVEQLFGRSQSPLGTVLGLLVAGVAVVGTQFLGWEWGSGQLIPTVIGVAVAGLAVVLVARRRFDVGD